jgi:hypothetical protein
VKMVLSLACLHSACVPATLDDQRKVLQDTHIPKTACTVTASLGLGFCL